MIFRWKCDLCKAEIKSGLDRLKVISFKKNPKDKYSTKTKHEGDICRKCWGGKDKAEPNPMEIIQ